MFNLNRFYISLLLILFFTGIAAQKPADDTLLYRTMPANTSFQQKSSFYKKLWGTNRRIEWATPITVPVLWLDTAYGGLKPYEAGGGNETRSLRLRTSTGKEYTLRSVNKSRDDVVPPDFKNTFVESIIKDAVSSSYPYGAFPVTVMQQQAGIHHTTPVLVYLPPQNALDTFNVKYGNDLYLFEQRPDGDWKEADELGNFKDFASTDKVIKKLLDDNKYTTDQHAFIKARLFDLLIGDWDRHEDNWRWGETKKAGTTLYSPIPRDRDQAFYTHNGVLVDFLLPIGGFSYMQDFRATQGNVRSLNIEECDFDRFFANQMSLDDWINAAKELQQKLTDTIIAISVQQLPPEIFAVSGNELIAKLRSRRDQLITSATTYYLFIAKEVEVTGSSKKEYFEIITTDSGEIAVSVSRMPDGKKDNDPYYRRTFKPAETKEIRLYGIDDKDVFKIDNNSSPITIRIIGGPDKDSVIHAGNSIHIYDDKNNTFQTSSAKLHLSSDSAVHAYNYESYKYDSKGWGPAFSYDHQDRVYVGLNYRFKVHKWRREPYAVQHVIGVNYSITQHAVSSSYSGIYPHIIKKWDVLLNARYDNAGWTNFSGLGNETIWNVATKDYYQMRGGESGASVGLRRELGKGTFTFSVFIQHVKITNDTGRYAAKVYQLTDPKVYDPGNYAGLRLAYSYAAVNDAIVPTKGFTFLATAMGANDLRQKEFFQTYTAKTQVYLPLTKKFSLSVKAGGATVVGNSSITNSARPYEHAMIGGPETFRGYRIERFWGKTSFYNNNELRFITNLRSYLLNGKIGLLTFFDDGRVWMPGENSNTLHTSYGAGFVLAPFHQLCFTLTYGISNEMKLVQFRFNTLF